MIALGGYSGGGGFDMTDALQGAQQYGRSQMGYGRGNSVDDLFNLINRRQNRSPFFAGTQGSRGGSDFNNPLALNFESDVGKTFGEGYIP